MIRDNEGNNMGAKLYARAYDTLARLETEGLTKENASAILDAIANFAADIIPFAAEAMHLPEEHVMDVFISVVKSEGNISIIPIKRSN
jgi:hypothetical protein